MSDQGATRGRNQSWVAQHISKSKVIENGVSRDKGTCKYCNTLYAYNTQTLEGTFIDA